MSSPHQPLDESSTEVRRDSADKTGPAIKGSNPSGLVSGNGEGASLEPSPPSQVQQQLLVILEKAELFHTPEQVPFARVPAHGHRPAFPVLSKRFRNWLRQMYFESTGQPPNSNALDEVIATAEARAEFEGSEQRVFLRVAERLGVVYFDLGRDDGKVVRIDSQDWRVVEDSPVPFGRPGSMLPLPIPTAGGDLLKLRGLLNIDDGEWPLITGWLVGALKPDGPFPILVLNGEQGSAKTTMAKMLKFVIDPSQADVRTPTQGQDLYVAAENGYVLAFDNVSAIKASMSNDFCRISTGAAFTTRTLYTNTDETVMRSVRPMILNGIGEIVTRGDLLSRSLILRLPPISADQRRTESEVWREFFEILPGVLGRLFDGVSQALLTSEDMELEELPRMADFARWVQAGETALGLEEGDFIAALKANDTASVEVALESSLVGQAVVRFMEDRSSYRDTPSGLLADLTDLVGEDVAHSQYWPRQPNRLSNDLQRIGPSLRAVGVDVQRGKSGRRYISLTSVEPDSDVTETNVDWSWADDDHPPAGSPESEYLI